MAMELKEEKKTYGWIIVAVITIIILNMTVPTLFLPILFALTTAFISYALLGWAWDRLPANVRSGAFLIIFISTGFGFYLAKSGYLPLTYMAYAMALGMPILTEAITIMLTLDISTLLVAGLFGYIFRKKM